MNLSELLEPIASLFRSLNLPQPITHWGHPIMMGIVIFVMGTAVAMTGWKGRIVTDNGVATENRKSHRKLAPWMFTFIALGYLGGLLSLVIQQQPILDSPHFWTGSSVLSLLAVNGFISLTGFGGDKKPLRTLHAYLGSLSLGIMVIHALLGIKLGITL